MNGLAAVTTLTDEQLAQPSSQLWIQYATQVVSTIGPQNATGCSSQGPASRPGDSLPDLVSFARHLVTTCQVSTATLLHALVYLKRLRDTLPVGALSRPGSSHRIFVAALLLASKYADDVQALTPRTIANILMHWQPLHTAWSRIALGGLSAQASVWWAFPKEIARIERAFLRLLKFELHVTPEDLAALTTT
ncbi:hypothetical protein H4R34_005423 [Dimargaris verticillata]|uniref:Cyclin N-terminal domain-containing protein n=1 Tax=Dimargaris verticillata TaxID=2761393 RepID=A0A9W8B2Y4_9FUNG|nr:hypothetical protein H4R34_005423 [Dimargaris verticillata]